MPGKRSYSGFRRFPRVAKKYRKLGSYHRGRAAGVIQRAFRRRRNRRRVYNVLKRRAVLRFNRSSKEMVFKSFTIEIPDSMLITQPPGDLVGRGIVSAEQRVLKECIEIGAILKDPAAPNLTEAFSQEFTNYLELYKQVRVVHGSISLMKFSPGLGDGTSATGTPPTSSVGYQGDPKWVAYAHSVIDTGAFKDVSSLQNLNIQPSANVASTVINEYFSNSNARLTQLSWDNKKSVKTKIICPTKKEEWSQQYYGIFSAAVPPVAGVQLRTNCPWLDTGVVEAVAKNTLPAGHPNYLSVYALMRLPPYTIFGNTFPQRVRYDGGAAPPVVPLVTPLFKGVISITCAFRVPTLRN